ncbi:MAG: glycosyltransferase [Nitrospiraceae bacterium]|nr:glycosyltransferase [Nitrospiraceae bacterium]
MGKIKVFHIVEAFGGGVFSSVSQLCSHLDKGKFELHVFYSTRPETPANFRDFFSPDVNLVHLPMTRAVSPSADLNAFISIMKILKKQKPDIVHLHSSKAGFLGRLACWLTGAQNVFYSPRGFAFLMKDSPALKRKIYYALEKFAATLGGTTVAVSSDELAYARRLAGSAVLIPNGVDLEIVRGEGHQFPANGRVYAGISGRITYARNPALYRNIAKSLKDRANFIWIGDGELKDALELPDSRITVTGWKSRQEGLKLLSGLDIYMQTSLWEGMPIAVLEAMALGKPVIATDIIGNRDLVVHGETGFLAKDEADFIHYLDILIGDAALRSAMGKKGKALIHERHDMKKIAARYGDLYLSAISKAGM